MDGRDVLKRLREWTSTPIVVMSVRHEESEKIACLDAGADDYLTKPFTMGELLARLRAALRRAFGSARIESFRSGNLKVDFNRREVFVGDDQIKLTATEYDLLKVLVHHAGLVRTHYQLIHELWGHTQYQDAVHLLRVTVSNLRRKLLCDPRFLALYRHRTGRWISPSRRCRLDSNAGGPLKSVAGDLGGSDASELEHSLTSLLRLSDSLNSIFDLDTLLDALVGQMLELTDAQAGCAGLRTSNGISCGRFLQGSRMVPMMYEPGSGWSGWVLTHGTSYLTNDALNDAVIVPEIRERFGVISGMSIPITDGQKDVIAVVEVYNKKSGEGFTPLDLKNGLAAAKIASLAIQNGLTYGNLTALAAFSRSLTLASDLEQILEVVAQHFDINFHRRAVILLPADRSLAVRHQASDFMATARELEAAAWCWKHTEETGAETTLIPDALAHYFPLTVRGEAIGVIGLMPVRGLVLYPEARASGWFHRAIRVNYRARDAGTTNAPASVPR